MTRAGQRLPSAILAGLLLTCALIASLALAKKPGDPPRVGLLSPGLSSTTKAAWDAFRGATKELGYVERKSVTYEFRSASETALRASSSVETECS